MFGADSASLIEGLADAMPCPDQMCAISHARLDQGPGTGDSVLNVHNPAGISFELLVDRCLDIGWADACGIPLAWNSGRGYVASTRYEPEGYGWSHTFGGGLLTTCGLTSTGMPSVDAEGRSHGLHGRIGHTPAENVRWRLDKGPQGGTRIVVEGDVFEAGLGSPRLLLHRRIVADVHRPVLTVEDEVCNLSRIRAGHMFRHHINLGFPLVGSGTLVDTQAAIVSTRDGGDPPQLPWQLDFNRMGEQVVYCLPRDSRCVTTVTAPDGSRSIAIAQETEGWPWLILWRDATPGVNVLGVEPSMSRDNGRAQAERDDEVNWLDPAQSQQYCTSISVL